jgi:hypothetical protein
MPRTSSSPPQRPPAPGPHLPPPSRRRRPPYPFVLEALDSLAPVTRPLFSCLAVYVGPKIVFALRDRPTHPADNGVWLATMEEHHASLKCAFPHMRSIGVLGKPTTGWQILPADAPDFESAALHACELVLRSDPRIGKIPKPKNKPMKR